MAPETIESRCEVRDIARTPRRSKLERRSAPRCRSGLAAPRRTSQYGCRRVALLATTPDLLTAISHYLWPALAAVVFVVLLPTIKRVLETRNYNIKVGGLDVTVQEASQNLEKQISDLQAEVSALKFHVAPAAGVAAAPRRGTSAGASAQGPGFASILWVDDQLVNVAYEISILQSRGVAVVTAQSTDEALGKLGSIQAVVTDSARTDNDHFNPSAGIDLVRRVHELRPSLPVFIYTLASIAQRIEREADEAGAAGVFSSSVDIIARLGPPPVVAS